MKKSWFALVMCAFVTVSVAAQNDSVTGTATPAVVAAKGKMLVAANGARLAAVYRVGADGSAQIILEGKIVTVPASTLTVADGRLITSLTKNEVLALR